MTSHMLQRGELSSRLEQTPGAALPWALCWSCSLGKLCRATHTSQLVERKVSAQHEPELQEVIPEQKQLQLPLQDSSPEPSTQTASVQGKSTALFCWKGKMGTWGRHPTYFPKRRWYTGEETQQMGVWRCTPDIYLEYINYIFNSHSLVAYSQLLKYSSGVD